MGPTYPPLPPDLVAFCEGGKSLLVGTCSRDLAPDCVRAVGLSVWPDASHYTVLVPQATAATSVQYLRENPRIALTVSQIHSHRTMQLKGIMLVMRAGSAADHELTTRYRAAFSEELSIIGMAQELPKRLGAWPCWAIDVQIQTVYAQTPGPDAGAQMPGVVRTL